MDQGVNVDVNKLKTEICKCGCPYYKERVIIARTPLLRRKVTQEEFETISYMACEHCREPHKESPEVAILNAQKILEEKHKKKVELIESCDYKDKDGKVCGYGYYKPRILIKRIPGVLVGQSVDQYNEITFYVCEKCGKPHKSAKVAVPKRAEIKAAIEAHSAAADTNPLKKV